MSLRLHLIPLVALAALAVTGCSRRNRPLPEAQARPHHLTQPVNYGWIHATFAGHPFLRLASVEQEDYKLPGKAVAEVRLARMEPEMAIRKEIQRLTLLGVAPDKRLRHITYVVRGIGDVEWGVLLGFWGRGDREIRWERPRGPEGAR